MPRVITDELIEQAKDFTNGLTRAERTAIFEDRMLEDTATNKRYINGKSVKETIDRMLEEGAKLSFSRQDKLGKQYAKMATRRRQHA